MANRGIGLASPGPTSLSEPITGTPAGQAIGPSAPLAAPPVPAGPTPDRPLAPQTRTGGQRSGIPQFQDDPIGAVGFVLQEFGAGLGGQELPSTRLRADVLESKRLELAQLQVGSQALEQGLRLIAQTSEENRPGVISDFAERFKEVMPGLGDTLTGMMDDIPSAKKLLSTIGEFAPQLQAACGSDTECMTKLIDSGFTDLLETERDKTSMPLVRAKLRTISGEMFANLDALAGVQKDEHGDFVMSLAELERANESLPEEADKLTSSEMKTIERNPQVAARFGITIKTPERIEFESRKLFESNLNIRENEQKQQAKLLDPDDEKSRFGNSMDGLALDTLLDYKALQDAGEPIPKDLEESARVAAHILSRERIGRSPEGDMIAVESMGVPPGLAPSEGASDSPVASEVPESPTAPETPETGTSRTKVTRIEGEGKFEELSARTADIVISIADLLDEAREAGETITGIPGALKRTAGGLARQSGVPVSTRSESLSRQVEVLKSQVLPALLNEGGKQISDADRRRLDKMVSSFDGFFAGAQVDEEGLRASLADMLSFIEGLE